MNRRSFLGAAAAAGGSVATTKKVAGQGRVGSAEGAETDFRNIEWGPKAKEILRRPGAGAVRALRLSPGPHLFVDWRLVKAGGVHWASKDTGERLPLQVRDSEGTRTRCGRANAWPRWRRRKTEVSPPFHCFPGAESSV